MIDAKMHKILFQFIALNLTVSENGNISLNLSLVWLEQLFSFPVSLQGSCLTPVCTPRIMFQASLECSFQGPYTFEIKWYLQCLQNKPAYFCKTTKICGSYYYARWEPFCCLCKHLGLTQLSLMVCRNGLKSLCYP